MFLRFKRSRPRPKSISKNQPAINSKIRRLVSGILAILLVTVIIAWAMFKLFIIKTLIVDNQTKSCINTLEVEDNLHLIGKRLVFISDQNIVVSLINKYPCIKSVKVARRFPQTLEITISPRKIFLVIEAQAEPDDFEKASRLLKIWESSNSGKQVESTAEASLIPTLDLNFNTATISGNFAVDDTGMVFAKDMQAAGIPHLSAYIESLEIGRRIDERIVKYINTILDRLSELGVKVVSEKLVKETYFILKAELPDQTLRNSILIFLLDRDNQKELASLQLILQRNRIDLRSIEVVDLRFDKPMVTFQKKK